MPGINDYIDSINYSIESIEKNKQEITEADIPSDFKLMVNNLSGNSRAMQFIFDTKIDKVIDNLLNKLLSGNYSDMDKYAELISKMFEHLGIGEDAFSGPVSQTLLTNMTNCMNSINFYDTKNKINKAMLLIRNLKIQSRNIKDKNIRKKYLEAVYALKKTLRFISKVYKDRRIITNRVKAGLNNLVHESYDEEDLDWNFNINDED